MIWESMTLMTIFDAVIIVITVLSLVFFVKYRIKVFGKKFNGGSYIIMFGIVVVGLFYVTDLFTMWILPSFTSHPQAMAVMENLHLNYKWIVMLVAILCIVGGFILMTREHAHLHHDLNGEIKERQDVEKALLSILEGTSKQTGVDFFQSLVKHLSLTLKFQFVFVGRIVNPERIEEIEILAAWGGDRIIENVTYNLDNTPCQNVMEQGLCFYPKDIQQLFPKDKLLVDMGAHSYTGIPLRSSKDNVIGILVLLDTKPMEAIPYGEQVLTIFANRASAELERHQIEEKFRVADFGMDHAGDGIFWLDSKARFCNVNQTGCTMSGYTKEEILRKTVFDIDPTYNEERWSEFWKELKKSETHIQESVLKVKDGTTIPIEVLSHFFVFEGKEYSFSFVRDITKRKQAEDSLRRSEEELRKQRDILEQKNIALKEVLEHIEMEKQQIKNDVIANVDHILIPALSKVRIKGGTQKHVDVLKRYLNDMTSSLGKKLTEKSVKLTAREIEICAMIKNGLMNKEIASLLSISLSTVERHRANIRRKFGISGEEVNLTSYLTTI